MNFNEIIENIRISINKENEIDNLQLNYKIKKVNQKNKEVSICNINKNYEVKTNNEPIIQKNIIKILNEEELERMINNNIEKLKFNNWNNLSVVTKKDRLKEFTFKNEIISQENKNKIYKTLISKLNKDLLNETTVIYNKEIGKIENIKILILNEKDDTFKFMKLKIKN